MRLILMALAVVMVCGDVVADDGLGNNAALRYYQAFLLMPNAPDAGKWDTMPLPVATTIADRATDMLDVAYRGAAIDACDWGMDLQMGLRASMPHLAKCRTLAQYACLRARVRLEAGDTEGAARDLALGMDIARHAGSDHVVISLIVRQGVETFVAKYAQANAATFTRQDAAILLAAVKPCDYRADARAAILMEGEVIVHTLRNGLPDDLRLASIGGQNIRLPEPPYTEEQLEAARETYDRLADLVDKPIAEATAKSAALKAELRESNSLVAGLVPDIPRLLTKTAEMEKLMADLRTELAKR